MVEKKQDIFDNPELLKQRVQVVGATALLVGAIGGLWAFTTGEREAPPERPPVVTVISEEIRARCAGSLLPDFCTAVEVARDSFSDK